MRITGGHLIAVAAVVAIAVTAFFLLRPSTNHGSSISASRGKTSTEQVVTRKEWATRADAMCAKALERLASLPNPQSFQQLADGLAMTSDLFERTADQIEALPMPPNDVARIRQMLTSFRATDRALQRERAALLRYDAKGMRAAVTESKQPAVRAGQLAFGLGLTQCSQHFSSASG